MCVSGMHTVNMLCGYTDLIVGAYESQAVFVLR